MYIFQANGKLPLSKELLDNWSKYIEEQCEKDTSILLPEYIDFVAAMSLDTNMMFTPVLDDVSDDDDNYEENETLDN